MVAIRFPKFTLVSALAALGEAEFVAREEELLAGKDEKARRWVMEFRARFPDRRLDAIRRGLGDPHALVRHAATRLAETYPDEALLAELGPCLADRVEPVRDQAARAVQRIASQSGALLGPILRHCCSAGVKAAPAVPDVAPAILTLQALRYPNQVPEILTALLEMLDTAGAEILGAVPETIVFCEDRSRLATELRARLGSSRRDTRVYSLYSLALLREPACEADFTAALGERDPVAIIAGATGLALLDARSAVPRLREAYEAATD